MTLGKNDALNINVCVTIRKGHFHQPQCTTARVTVGKITPAMNDNALNAAADCAMRSGKTSSRMSIEGIKNGVSTQYRNSNTPTRNPMSSRVKSLEKRRLGARSPTGFPQRNGPTWPHVLPMKLALLAQVSYVKGKPYDLQRVDMLCGAVFAALRAWQSHAAASPPRKGCESASRLVIRSEGSYRRSCSSKSRAESESASAPGEPLRRSRPN